MLFIVNFLFDSYGCLVRVVLVIVRQLLVCMMVVLMCVLLWLVGVVCMMFQIRLLYSGVICEVFQFIYFLVWVCFIGFLVYSVFSVQCVFRQCMMVFDFYSGRLWFLIIGIRLLGFIVWYFGVCVLLWLLLILMDWYGRLIFLVYYSILWMLLELWWFQIFNMWVFFVGNVSGNDMFD